MPLDERGDDYVQASLGAWTVLAILLFAASLLIGTNDSWPASVGLSALTAAPAGMGVLRGVYDRARGRYTAGGLPFVVALVVAFLGVLAAVQPVR